MSASVFSTYTSRSVQTDMDKSWDEPVISKIHRVNYMEKI